MQARYIHCDRKEAECMCTDARRLPRLSWEEEVVFSSDCFYFFLVKSSVENESGWEGGVLEIWENRKRHEIVLLETKTVKEL